MDKPQLGYSCPQGLEYLAILDKLTVQKKLELVESKSNIFPDCFANVEASIAPGSPDCLMQSATHPPHAREIPTRWTQLILEQ